MYYRRHLGSPEGLRPRATEQQVRSTNCDRGTGHPSCVRSCMASAQNSTFWLTCCLLPGHWSGRVRLQGAHTTADTAQLAEENGAHREEPSPWPLRVRGSSHQAHPSGHLAAREGNKEGFHTHPWGSWVLRCHLAVGTWRGTPRAARSPGGLHPGAAADEWPLSTPC